MRITKELIEIDDMDPKDRTPEQQRALTAYYREARMFQEERRRQLAREAAPNREQVELMERDPEYKA